jgi:hypothetical protein
LPSKPNNDKQPIQKNVADSSLSATALNLSNGFAVTLIDHIMVEKNKESRGTTLAEARDKHYDTAKKDWKPIKRDVWLG